MNPLIAEFIGTAILVLLGNGVVANAILKDTKGSPGNWVLITAGWGLAVYVAVLCTAPYSGAHINPAVTVGLVAAGLFPAADMPGYILAQLAGGMTGAVLVFVTYRNHFNASDDQGAKLGCFSTAPNIRSIPTNFFSELIGTFILVFAVLGISEGTISWVGSGAENLPEGKVGLGSIGALPVALVVVSIGMSLGGTTGYAINPARDLGPRIVHQLLPIRGKGDSDWPYAWVPIVGPIAGALLAAVIYAAVM
ncbi:aquaporin family protein [Verrucomicrobiaceae bacterium N1E253]|uniref:Aquaporin family protein n=1 Tax=Oceaniferula marina TaxID=2748318 RepID=A0A851GTE1_9BACT|nr:MIP/aquaporin family protein [Oceaniferula marina]NWK57554.1 aquaporin family protein [Oceaniferula marina]